MKRFVVAVFSLFFVFTSIVIPATGGGGSFPSPSLIAGFSVRMPDGNTVQFSPEILLRQWEARGATALTEREVTFQEELEALRRGGQAELVRLLRARQGIAIVQAQVERDRQVQARFGALAIFDPVPGASRAWGVVRRFAGRVSGATGFVTRVASPLGIPAAVAAVTDNTTVRLAATAVGLGLSIRGAQDHHQLTAAAMAAEDAALFDEWIRRNGEMLVALSQTRDQFDQIIAQGGATQMTVVAAAAGIAALQGEVHSLHERLDAAGVPDGGLGRLSAPAPVTAPLPLEGAQRRLPTDTTRAALDDAGGAGAGPLEMRPPAGDRREFSLFDCTIVPHAGGNGQ